MHSSPLTALARYHAGGGIGGGLVLNTGLSLSEAVAQHRQWTALRDSLVKGDRVCVTLRPRAGVIEIAKNGASPPIVVSLVALAESAASAASVPFSRPQRIVLSLRTRCAAPSAPKT